QLECSGSGLYGDAVASEYVAVLARYRDSGLEGSEIMVESAGSGTNGLYEGAWRVNAARYGARKCGHAAHRAAYSTQAEEGDSDLPGGDGGNPCQELQHHLHYRRQLGDDTTYVRLGEAGCIAAI